MKKVIERIVESPGAPNENDLWLNGKTLKRFQNGEWEAISGGNGSGGGSDSGCSCPGVMIVEGTIVDDDGKFTPNEGSPSIFEAIDLLKSGGIVYLKTQSMIHVAGYGVDNGDEGLSAGAPFGGFIVWLAPILVHGTISNPDAGHPDWYFFEENSGQMNASTAKNSFDDGMSVSLSYEISGETIIDAIETYGSDLSVLITERGILWNVGFLPVG